MNIYDISREAGVSIATVSRVLNGSTSVSPATRQKVMNVIERLNYTPNALARGLSLNSSHTIGILCADSSDAYLATDVYYLETNLRQQGYDSILCCTGYDQDTRIKYTDILLSKKVDALIFVGSTFTSPDPAMNQYIADAAASVPVVLLNGYLDADNVFSILCDDMAATYQITARLIASGHDRLLFLHHPLSYSTRRKVQGFCDAHKDAGIHLLDTQCQELHMPMEQAIAHLQATFGILPFFNGIITTNDELAATALKYCKKCGMRIPEDIFIVGYNNSRLTRFVDPELSSIDNKPEEVCLLAVRTLMQVLSGETPPGRQVVTSTLIERDSTAF